MRLGTLSLGVSYVVDFDDEDMVAEAKQALCEDIDNMVKYNETWGSIAVERTGAETADEIPGFLRESAEERKYEG